MKKLIDVLLGIYLMVASFVWNIGFIKCIVKEKRICYCVFWWAILILLFVICIRIIDKNDKGI